VLRAFGWGAIAAGSLLLGAVIAVVRPPGSRMLGLVMAFGSGVLLSAVSFELVVQAVETSGDLRAATFGLFAGAVTFTVGDQLISRFGYRDRKDIDGVPPDAGGLSIVLGALLDGLPESAVLGLTLLGTGDIGVAMLVAVFLSNLPEGVAATTSLRNGGWSTRQTTALWSGVVVACALAASLGYALLDGASTDTIAFIFTFAAGAILTMLATSMMPEAYEHAARTAGLATVLGFAVAFSISWLES
jgi:zinc transporter, ZIP family